MSDKVFDLLAGGFTQGRYAAKIHCVGLHQIRVKLMVADDLAKPIADLRPTVVSIGRLRRNLAHLPIGFRLGNRSDLLDRADADSIRFAERATYGPSFGHTHFGALHAWLNSGRISIAISDAAPPVPA